MCKSILLLLQNLATELLRRPFEPKIDTSIILKFQFGVLNTMIYIGRVNYHGVSILLSPLFIGNFFL